MGRAEKYALIQSQVLIWALVAVVAYLFATKFSLIVALLYLAFVAALFIWIIVRIRREGRRPEK